MTLDAATLGEMLAMVGDDAAFVDEVVDAYLADAPGQVHGMEAALAGGDVATLGRLAHTLKGNSLNVGASALAAIARSLEEQARAGDLSGAAPRIEAAAEELTRVVRALEDARARRWVP